jgi:hypothetical protein
LPSPRIAFGASTIYLAVQLNEERAQADEVSATMAALNARIAELEKAREQRFATSGVFGGDALAQGGMAMVPPPPPDKGEVELKTGEGAVVFNSTPPPRSEAFEKMMRTNMRANNKRLYADVGEKLGLSKEDTNKLINMLTEQQVDNFGRMREIQGNDPASAGWPWKMRDATTRRRSMPSLAPRRPRHCATTRTRFRRGRKWSRSRVSSKVPTPT